MTADNGGAPHIANGLLSLAICKPMVRHKADKDDVIFGFGGKHLGERLIYIAVIERKMKGNEYYVDPAYSNRSDCIYAVSKDGESAVAKPTRKYHEASFHLDRDVGPHFEYGDVLLSRNFRYFGSSPISISLADNYPLIADMLLRLTRGHRVNHDPRRQEQLESFKNCIFKYYPASDSAKCSDSDCSISCSGSEIEIKIDENETSILDDDHSIVLNAPATLGLTKCAKCGKQISYKAEKCPYCGVKVKKNTGAFAILLLSLIFAFLILIVIVSGTTTTQKTIDASTINSAHSAQENAAKSTSSIQSRAHSQDAKSEFDPIDVNDLNKSYEFNQIKADNDFSGKWLLITGPVNRIAKDLDGRPILGLSLENRGFNLTCEFSDPDEIKKLAALLPGQEISIFGYCQDKMGSAYFVNCKIVSLSKVTDKTHVDF